MPYYVEIVPPVRSHQQLTRRHGRSVPVRPSEPTELALDILEATGGSTCLVNGAGTIVATNTIWRLLRLENDGDQARTGVGDNYLDVLEVAAGEDAAAATRWSKQLAEVLAGTLESFEFEYCCDASGEQRWFAARVHSVSGFGACINHVDVSEAKQAQLALQQALVHDPGTQLPNRRAIETTIADVAALARAEGSGVAVVMLGLEGISRVSENLGHAAVDGLLTDIAQRLGEYLPEGAALGRFASDTYVAVWHGLADAAQAVATAERLLASLSQPFKLAAGSVDVFASIGVVFECGLLATPDQLIRDAESATHQARTTHGSRVQLFTTDLRVRAADRWRLEHEIRAGLLKDEFVLHYQPLVDLRSGCVIGVEALVRWQHPDGMRMPDSFVSVAESSGLIVPLGAWVLREACRQWAAWKATGLDLRVAVNFSAQQIAHNDIVSTIDDALAATGMRGDRLLVEVTESTVLEQANRTKVVLDEIRARGIEIALDDFGTGYSSLLYLKRYPIQALKVDRQFVAGLGTTTEDDAIVAGVIAFARAVGATCIAEGVETVTQYELLLALRCRFAQGHLFSPPVPAREVPTAIDAAGATFAKLSGRPPGAASDFSGLAERLS